jgi:hypothetical protein
VVWGAGKVELAHRHVYKNEIGEIADGMLVCHTCDNPSCVNPEHLFIGTNDDNMKDRDKKNRVAHGDAHYKAKLSSDDVSKIKRRLDVGDKQEDVADDFGVCRGTISAIATGRTWRRVN